MFKLQICCLTMVIFITVLYFSAKRKRSHAHSLFKLLSVTTIINLISDIFSVYTVNHLDTVPAEWNHLVHQMFIGSIVTILFVVFIYTVALIREETEDTDHINQFWLIPLLISFAAVIFWPMYYQRTPKGNYAYGPGVEIAYFSVVFYLAVSIMFIVKYWSQINPKKRFVFVSALCIEGVTSLIQKVIPTALVTSFGFSMLILAFYMTLENPDVHLIERLQEEKDRANQANKAKSMFLASMSHEIRTPINAILGMNEMILRESKERGVRQYASDIKSAAQTLYSIINDVLDLSKIESGKMEIIPVRYELSSFLHDIVNMISFRAREKKLDFFVEVSPELPVGLYGDDIRLRQILVNLLTNAVKYTQDGSVTLCVNGEVNDDSVFLEFVVRDTGIGIKKENIDRLFSKFQRIDEIQNRKIEGTGLGMSIIRQLLQMMDSELHVESEYGEGSLFSFVVKQWIVKKEPIGDFNRRIRTITDQNDYEVAFLAPKARILVVDDNALNRKVFTNLLKQTQIQITEADGGQACLDLITKERFDLIFLDHMMPDMDGIEAFRRMKTMEDNLCQNAKIIALTANAVVGAREEYLDIGFDAFLSKPIIPEALEKLIYKMLPEDMVEIVERVFDDSEHVYMSIEEVQEENTERVLQKMDMEWMKELPEIPGINWNYAAMYLPEREVLMYSLQEFGDDIHDMLERYDQLVERLHQEDERNELARRMHGLKSSAAMVGAVLISELAKKIEQTAQEANEQQTLKYYRMLTDELTVMEQQLKIALKRQNVKGITVEEMEQQIQKLFICMQEGEAERAKNELAIFSEMPLPEKLFGACEMLKGMIERGDFENGMAVVNAMKMQLEKGKDS